MLLHDTECCQIKNEFSFTISVEEYFLDIPCMVIYSCKKFGESNYHTPQAFWSITDFDVTRERGRPINTITLEEGELKKQV